MPGRSGTPLGAGLATEPVPGVNVVGWLRAESGVGEIARRLALASELAGIPTSTVDWARTASRRSHAFTAPGDGSAPYDTNIICVNAADLARLRRDFGPGLFAGRYSIGVWFWELARFPRYHDAFGLVDEVWAASDFTRDAIAAETRKPVLVVPIPLGPPELEPITRAQLNLPERFVFLFSFDFSSVADRKNPYGLVEAFRRAFAPDEGPLLVIKTINGDRKPEPLGRLREAAAGRSDIDVRDGYLSREATDALMATCDCYVSLHRSEGLGLTMAEAMSHGKPVIATGYSGNVSFMNEGNSYLVRYRLTDTGGGTFYPPGLEWAEPDLDHAAALMRRVYDHPEEARQRGARARRDLLTHHSVDRTSEFIRARLAELPKHESLLREVRSPVERAAAIASKQPGAALVREHRRSPRALLRRLLRRALWPELAEQRRIDEALIEAVRALELINRTEFAERLATLEQPGPDVDRASTKRRTSPPGQA